ncbi:MAG: pyridoxal phosphate-dependent aminotransferase [Spirochaetia bacterium]|jgi:aspartate/methionine/tyrosine aminotransferase
MFSHRVPADHSTNRLSAAIEEQRARGAPILDLTESNPTRCGFQHDDRALLGALASPGALLYEPHPQGLAAARTAIRGYYAEIGSVVDAESLFLTTGTSEAYTQVFKLLADPGDEILAPTPGYPLLDVLTGLEAVRLVHYPLVYGEPGGWMIDRERLRASISTRTRAIVVVSPNNPTGSYLKHGEREECNSLCRDFGLALIVDEVFSDYGRGQDPARVRTAAGNQGALTFTLNGFSKLVGLPQLKLGWIHVSGPPHLAAQACERLAFVTDAFLSVSSVAQHAAPAIFRQRVLVQAQINRRLEENGRALEECVTGLACCRLLQREGGWYAVVRIAEETSDEDFAVHLLQEDGVLVHPGYFYDFPAGSFLVLSLLPPTGAFREGAERLAARLRSGGAMP